MKLKLVYIEWCDAVGDMRWVGNIESAKRWGETASWVVKEVGWIVDETDEYICFISRIIEDDDDELCGGLHKIPKTWIRKRKILKI